MDLSFGGIIDNNQREQPEHIPASETRTVTMNLLSGLFSGQNKHLWLSAMGPIVIECELADASVPCKLGEHSAAVAATATTPAVATVQRTNEWKINNCFCMGSVVDLSPDLINAYTKHLEEGKSLPYSFGTYATVQHAIQRPADFSVNQSRAFSRLTTIFAVFSQPRTPFDSEVSYFLASAKTVSMNIRCFRQMTIWRRTSHWAARDIRSIPRRNWRTTGCTTFRPLGN